jgi:hypothetical protein
MNGSSSGLDRVQAGEEFSRENKRVRACISHPRLLALRIIIAGSKSRGSILHNKLSDESLTIVLDCIDHCTSINVFTEHAEFPDKKLSRDISG